MWNDHWAPPVELLNTLLALLLHQGLFHEATQVLRAPRPAKRNSRAARATPRKHRPAPCAPSPPPSSYCFPYHVSYGSLNPPPPPRIPRTARCAVRGAGSCDAAAGGRLQVQG